MTSCTGSARGGFWEIWKSQLVELSLAVRRRRVTFASLQWPCGGCHTCWWGRWKSQHRKIVPLSPYVEKPLNSKGIKSFVPELRRRKCFSCFGITMFYVYMLRTFYVRFAYSCIWLCYRWGMFQINRYLFCQIFNLGICSLRCLYVKPYLSMLFQSVVFRIVSFDVKAIWGQCLDSFYFTVIVIFLFISIGSHLSVNVVV